MFRVESLLGLWGFNGFRGLGLGFRVHGSGVFFGCNFGIYLLDFPGGVWDLVGK